MKVAANHGSFGALLKCWCHTKMLGLYWKCCHTIETLTYYWNVVALYNQTCQKLHPLYKLTVSLLFGLAKLSHARQLMWRTASVPAHLGRTGQIAAFYSNDGVLLKWWRSTQMYCRCPIESHWKWAVYISATRNHIKKQGVFCSCKPWKSLVKG